MFILPEQYRPLTGEVGSQKGPLHLDTTGRAFALRNGEDARPVGQDVVARAGELIELSTDGVAATISSVGATLRRLRVGGSDVLLADPDGALTRGAKGQVLAPWPNRLEDGAYRIADQSAQAAIDDLEHHCAIHGLVRWLDWQVLAKERDLVRLRAPMAAQPAFPFVLDLEVEYRVSDGGLEVRAQAANRDDRPVPFALGFHPYLAAGDDGLDAAAVALPSHTRLVLDERGLPVRGAPPVEEPFAVGEKISLAGRLLDDCFIARPANGRWEAVFWPDAATEHVVRLWAEDCFGYLMCFTADTLAPQERRRGLALEPMTAPPNAMRTGTGLRMLAPAEVFRGRWGIALGTSGLLTRSSCDDLGTVQGDERDASTA